MQNGKIAGVVRGLLFWIVGSLFAVLLLEYNALLGLALALIFGVGLGVLLFQSDPTP